MYKTNTRVKRKKNKLIILKINLKELRSNLTN